MTRISTCLGLVAVALGVVATATQPPPPPSPPSFSTATRTVAVYATVTNAGGRLVTDLTRDDFTIADNDKPQTLTLFSNDVQPITIVVLLDRSSSMQPNFDLEAQGAEAFVRALGADDKARIGSFANEIRIDPDDRRWWWLAALCLLSVESWMRRAKPSDRAQVTQEEQARVA